MLPIEKLPNAAASEQVEVLSQLFEPCVTLSTFVRETVLPTEFSSYKEMIEQVRVELLDLLKENESDPRIAKIIAAHPRLGAPKPTQKVTLSEHSSAEQKSLGGADPEETRKLQELNESYEHTFPGLRYVVFVNGRSREIVMKDMKQRIERNDISLERLEAFEAMCDIALDRARKMGSE